MKILRAFWVPLTSAIAMSAAPATAGIIISAPDHYILKHEAVSTLTPDALWQKLIEPANWWHPDHTYSGDAKNLSLDANAGGVWREDWPDGSVEHGRVLLVLENKQLRLNAPFGPLQETGANVVWTVTISSGDDGTKVTFDEVANGTASSNLDELAPAVDFVKTEAINRLIAD